MTKLIARKTAKMSDGRVFITVDKEYEVVSELAGVYHIHTELEVNHVFSKNPDSSAFYGKYFILEGEDLVKEEAPVEEVKVEVKEEVKNTYNKKRK
jgi:hypothetical protein